MSQEKKITVTSNGPYEVSGRVNLNEAVIVVDRDKASESWEIGPGYKIAEEPYYLCRCGHSDNKPFCDGHHKKVGFTGQERAGRRPYVQHAARQTGPGADLLDDSSLCVGARFCDRGDTAWGLIKESDDPDKLRQAIEEACNCPAGRLTVVSDEGRHWEPELPQEISLIQDPVKACRGPLWVKGGLTIRGQGGEEYETRNRVTLCRCGRSENQPYCDGSHYECEVMHGRDKDPNATSDV